MEITGAIGLTLRHSLSGHSMQSQYCCILGVLLGVLSFRVVQSIIVNSQTISGSFKSRSFCPEPLTIFANRITRGSNELQLLVAEQISSPDSIDPSLFKKGHCGVWSPSLRRPAQLFRAKSVKPISDALFAISAFRICRELDQAVVAA